MFMNKKIIWIIVAVLVIVIVGIYFWWSNKKTAPEDVGVSNANGSAAVQDCGSNLACGNSLLGACTPGTFTAKSADGRQTIKTTIVQTNGNNCIIDSAQLLTEMVPFADASVDTDGDGMLIMRCSVPKGLNFGGLTTFLQGQGLAYCTGELKTFYDSLGI